MFNELITKNDIRPDYLGLFGFIPDNNTSLIDLTMELTPVNSAHSAHSHRDTHTASYRFAYKQLLKLAQRNAMIRCIS